MGPTWTHLGPVGPSCAPCWPHEPCYQGPLLISTPCCCVSPHTCMLQREWKHRHSYSFQLCKALYPQPTWRDVTSDLNWHMGIPQAQTAPLESHRLNTMVSQTAGNPSVCLIEADRKADMKALHYLHFVRRIQRWPVGPPHKGPVLWKGCYFMI